MIDSTVPNSSPPSPSDPAPELAALPRWPAVVALLAVVGLYMGLPDELSLVPQWILAAVTIVLLIPTTVSHRVGKHELNQIFGYIVNGVETFALIASVALLVIALPKGIEKPVPLLESAALLWVTNILVFALWYWRLDAGGPHRRDARPGHPSGAILFPQMTLDNDNPAYDANWSPDFVDYLFVAFNTSTAFSPTDAPILTRWAKILTMIQSLISLTIIALLAARAVNILG
ncbi:hypothetical protein IAD21_03061 [Abditibacteriota bacterium]|nr:hypothetical protein IAD21_03061 [Abditibacteriota bacterium]